LAASEDKQLVRLVSRKNEFFQPLLVSIASRWNLHFIQRPWETHTIIWKYMLGWAVEGNNFLMVTLLFQLKKLLNAARFGFCGIHIINLCRHLENAN